ncbi:hypothetical protein [Streptomyces rapamycinicus]|uniref:Uncharacterized protein n=2 Tax=Streptomyces rapamycinicus TaxID=1226757 RepID=A0A0A0NDY4_STRRN|nr:hypothetical protein [Streptomyces rapamycinicus]AGP55421.1 hypothetical protein M271_19360 [Streptomyces rapamycinicus NRRL 5491]MBB4782981.1 hypothetical protein [Streptomyces rapamycinicus]RLV81543.1 hypothetical protein D3C57_124200 [Streptomyces rapamycinicus NRRL 5491]UTO63433.1 hypothetical protein LJB45_14595 [Streptomyces rapamycinicus]UTP31390.1 hypothetical protein LIV37_19710 [Streptomyces rapamycinicus NRRL 5491]
MSESTVSGQSDSPAVALGPIALVLGVFSVVGAWVPTLVLVALPWTVIAGALAIALGAMGVHHARRGVGRLWAAVVGTGLGVVGFGGVIALLWSFGG